MTNNLTILIIDRYNSYETLFYRSVDKKVIVVKSYYQAIDYLDKNEIDIIVVNPYSDNDEIDIKSIFRTTNYAIPIILTMPYYTPNYFRENLEIGVSAFYNSSQSDNEKLKSIILKTIENYKKFPLNINNAPEYYASIAGKLPKGVKDFIEKKRTNPDAPIYIYGMENTGKKFFLMHIFHEYYRGINIHVLDVKKESTDTLKEKIKNLLVGTQNNEQIIIEGIETAHSSLRESFGKLTEKYTNLIFITHEKLEHSQTTQILGFTYWKRLLDNSMEVRPLSAMNADEKEHLIDYFLTLSTVCPIGSPLRGEKPLSKEIFTPEMLQLLKERDWGPHLRELSKMLQHIICNAENSYSGIQPPIGKIGKEYLPERFFEKKGEEKEAAKFIQNIENQIRTQGEQFKKSLEIELKLKEIYRKHPKLFNSKESEQVCEHFKFEPNFTKAICILIVSHVKSEGYTNEFLNHFNTVIKKYPIQIKTYLEFGTPASETHNFIEKADLILIKFCNDLINWTEWEKSISPRIKKLKPLPKVIPVLTRSCLWDTDKFYKEFRIINQTPLSTLEDAKREEAIIAIIQALVAEIETFKSH